MSLRTSRGESFRMRSTSRRLASMRGSSASACQSPFNSASAACSFPRNSRIFAHFALPVMAAQTSRAQPHRIVNAIQPQQTPGKQLRRQQHAISFDQFQTPRRSQRPTSRRDDGAPPLPGCTGISIRRFWRAAPTPRHRHTQKNLRRILRFHPASRAGTWPRIRRATGFLPRDHIALRPTRRCRARDSGHRDKSNGPLCRSGVDLHAPEFSKRPCPRPAARRMRSPTSASQSGSASASLLSSATNSVSDAAKPWLLAAQKPRFSDSGSDVGLEDWYFFRTPLVPSPASHRPIRCPPPPLQTAGSNFAA